MVENRFNATGRGIKWYGGSINMTLHVSFCMPSFVLLHWLFFAVHMLAWKNKKKKMMNDAIPIY